MHVTSRRSVHDRIDPEVAAGLAAYLSVTGPKGLNAIRDLTERRNRFAELMAGSGARNGGDPRIQTEDFRAPGTRDAPDVPVRLYRPIHADEGSPALLFVHGGGMVMGSVETSDATAAALAGDTGFTIVSVDYRLAPEHPHPAPVEDCFAALVWLADRTAALSIDPARLGIYGTSAGGGLSAGVSLLARDRGGPPLALQVLISPMLDDRNTSPSSREILDLGVWDRDANLEGWDALLGAAAGGPDVSPYAAPARATDLSGMPPTYIDVGELDLFRDESIEYASRLLAAGVPTELHVFPGGIHGTDAFAPQSAVARRVVEYRLDAIRRGL